MDMIELNLRKTLFPISMLALAILSGWMISVSEKWILLFPAIGIAIIVLRKPFWGLLLFTMLIPLESSFLSISGGASTVTRFLGIIIFGVWITPVISRRLKISIPSGLKMAIIFFFWGSISILWAFSQGAAVARIQTALQLVMLALLVVNMIHEQKQLIALLIALFIGCFIVTFLGMVGIGVESAGYLLTLQNQGAKEYGCYIGIFFLLGSILFVFEKGRYRWLGLAAIVLSTVPLIRVNERGIFLAIILTWVVIALITRKKTRAFIFIALMAVTMFFLPALLQQKGIITSHLAERLTIQNILETGGTGRTEIWGAGFRMFTSNFLIGTGWGNFPIVFNKYATPNEIIDSNYSLNGKDAHADLMGVAGELGIIGIVLFLVFYFRILLQIFAVYKNDSNVSNKILLVFVIALLIYIFSAGLSTTFLWRKIYWLILGMGILAPKLMTINEHQNERQGIIASSSPNE
jgi:O-antigen ligase